MSDLTDHPLDLVRVDYVPPTPGDDHGGTVTIDGATYVLPPLPEGHDIRMSFSRSPARCFISWFAEGTPGERPLRTASAALTQQEKP